MIFTMFSLAIDLIVLIFDEDRLKYSEILKLKRLGSPPNIIQGKETDLNHKIYMNSLTQQFHF